MPGHILALLCALAAIAIGIQSILTRKARFLLMKKGRAGDETWQTVEGFPAIIIGLFEIAVGIALFANRQTLW